MTNTDSCRAYKPSGTEPGADGAPFSLADPAVAMEIDPDRTVPIALSDNPGAAALLDPDRTLPMEPGTLVLFAGRRSLHAVSPVEGPTSRLVALLAYDTRPGTDSTPLLKRIRYGREA